MTKNIIIHKQNGKIEDFNLKKLNNSVKKSCLAIGNVEYQANLFADKTCQLITAWLKDKTEITTSDMRLQVTNALSNYSIQATEYYKDFKEIF